MQVFLTVHNTVGHSIISTAAKLPSSPAPCIPDVSQLDSFVQICLYYCDSLSLPQTSSQRLPCVNVGPFSKRGFAKYSRVCGILLGRPGVEVRLVFACCKSRQSHLDSSSHRPNVVELGLHALSPCLPICATYLMAQLALSQAIRYNNLLQCTATARE